MVYYPRLDTRVLILTVPSLVVLGLLVVHSYKTLPRTRAHAFWSGVALYGILRGVALRWVIDRLPGASFPYAIRNPLFPILGVPVQEIAGWAIVAYLGWWLGSRFSRYLFLQIAWAFLFLGAISWAVESAAVAAGWWSWAVPVTQPLFVNVPFIAIVDWSFVGFDFVLPFVVLSAPELRGRATRFAALLAFPVHFASHCFAGSSLYDIPIHHLVHWTLVASVVWLALRSLVLDDPFGGAGAVRHHDWLPAAGLSIIVFDAAAVELVLARRPELLVSILPALAASLQPLGPAIGYATGGLAVLLGFWRTPIAVAAVPAATAGLLTWGRRHERWTPIAALGILAFTAYHVHSSSAREQGELIRRLDLAISARDRGELDAAKRELTALADDFPGSHVPFALLGEIDYRTERLDDAMTAFARAVEIKQDYTKGFRYLAVIGLRLGRKDVAARFAERGLGIDQNDPELLYLSQTARERHDVAGRIDARDPRTLQALASLAFEIGDTAGAAALLDRGIALWPEQRPFYPSRVKLALQLGDAAGARRVAAEWGARFPQDAEARQLSRQFGLE